MKLTETHPELAHSLQRAYSGEKATALAYIGHAASLASLEERERGKEIEQDEWDHHKHVKQLMEQYEVPISSYCE